MKEALPFLLQGLLMSVDEIYCHRRRELRRWERLGHPLDTLFYLACLLWILPNSPTESALWIFVILSVGSCLFITKDEWQHRTLCSGFENWLHAILFMLHPLLLVVAGWLWYTQDPFFQILVGTVAALSALFAIYQFAYWNLWR